MPKPVNMSFSTAVSAALDDYFDSLNGEAPAQLHKLVIDEVEKTLVQNIMQRTDGNQSEAAKILGVNRNTLRSRLEKFDLLP
ncbi:MAG: helix-turn-helix domain-containing protein [Arenicellales bacterium]